MIFLLGAGKDFPYQGAMFTKHIWGGGGQFNNVRIFGDIMTLFQTSSTMGNPVNYNVVEVILQSSVYQSNFIFSSGCRRMQQLPQ